MGFGHRVYKTDDPRSLLLRSVSASLGGPLVEFSQSVERTTVDVLAELKPGRQLYTNVEFYAGVVMQTCGIPVRCSPRPSRWGAPSGGAATSWSRPPQPPDPSGRPLRGATPPQPVPLPGH